MPLGSETLDVSVSLPKDGEWMMTGASFGFQGLQQHWHRVWKGTEYCGHGALHTSRRAASKSSSEVPDEEVGSFFSAVLAFLCFLLSGFSEDCSS